MRTETHSWLKHVDILGDKVEKVVADGGDRDTAIKEAAHLSVEIDGFNFIDICTDLAGKEVRNEFVAQVDLHAFASAVFTERVGL